jgi:hypothetical protein
MPVLLSSDLTIEALSLAKSKVEFSLCLKYLAEGHMPLKVEVTGRVHTGWTIGVRFPAGAEKGFFLFIASRPAALGPTHPMGTGGSSPGDKAALS